MIDGIASGESRSVRARDLAVVVALLGVLAGCDSPAVKGTFVGSCYGGDGRASACLTLMPDTIDVIEPDGTAIPASIDRKYGVFHVERATTSPSYWLRQHTNARSWVRDVGSIPYDEFLATSAHELDFGLASTNRRTTMPTKPTSLSLSITTPVDSGGAPTRFDVFSESIGGCLTTSVTVASGGTSDVQIPWPIGLVDARQGDVLRVVQYDPGAKEIVAVGTIDDLVLRDGTTESRAVTLVSVDPGPLTVDIRYGAMANAAREGHADAGECVAATRRVRVTTPFASLVLPLDLVSTCAIASAFGDGSVALPPSDQTVAFRAPDPYPSSFLRFLEVEVFDQVDFTSPFTGDPYSWSVGFTLAVPLADATTTPVDATVSMPLHLRIDDQDASGTTFVAASPRLTWDPPTVGTPSIYVVDVTRLVEGVTAAPLPIDRARFFTTRTEITIPDDVLEPGTLHHFFVRAIDAPEVDWERAPEPTFPLRTIASAMTGPVVR